MKGWRASIRRLVNREDDLSLWRRVVIRAVDPTEAYMRRMEPRFKRGQSRTGAGWTGYEPLSVRPGGASGSISADLRTRGYAAEGIHGDMTQQKRNKVMDRFRKGDVDILVATDVAARGIDVTGVEAVFNFEIPQDEESYVHRIGRTGRAGRTGKAFSLVSGSEMYRFRDIKRYTKAVITRLAVPSFKEVEEVKVNKVLDTIRKAIAEKHLESYAQVVETLLKEDFTSLLRAAEKARAFCLNARLAIHLQ